MGVRCIRCARTQPPLPGRVRTCVYCSAPLPVQRWRADPPPAGTVPPGRSPEAPGTALHRGSSGVRHRPYSGPPSYGPQHPTWGFPTMVWRPARVGDPVQTAAAPRRPPLVVAAVLCGLTCAVALTAAGGEIWRFVLLLRGRTEVLSGRLVRASDATVTLAATATVVLAVVAAAVVVPLLVRLHALAARRAGLAPSRAPAAVLARLVVPGWNLYGLGVVAGEIDGQLAAPERSRPRLSLLVMALWAAWVLDAVLVVVTLVRAFGTSDQAVADTVELHIAVDLAGAVVAGLWAVLLLRFRRGLVGRAGPRASRWVVRPPEPTRAVPGPSTPEPPAPVTKQPTGTPAPSERRGTPATAEPTRTTAPAEPTGTTAPAEPTGMTAPAEPTGMTTAEAAATAPADEPPAPTAATPSR